MNKVIMSGRLIKDPELKTLASNTSVCQFSIAVKRNYKDTTGNKKTDFFNCIAWRSTGELIHKYFVKGNPIAIIGELNNREYQRQDGTKAIITEIKIDSVEFIEGVKQQTQNNNTQTRISTEELTKIEPSFMKEPFVEDADADYFDPFNEEDK